MATSDAALIETAAVDYITADRAASWEWFLHLLSENGYEGQPIWDDARALARDSRPNRRQLRLQLRDRAAALAAAK